MNKDIPWAEPNTDDKHVFNKKSELMLMRRATASV